MATQRILQNVPASLSVTLVDSDGSPRAAVGDVSVEVKRADGTVLVAETAAIAGTGVGAFTAPLTAAQASSLDELSATWTEVGGGIYQTTVDIVGGYYFSIDEARRAAPNFTDKQKYPDALVLKVRQEVEEECERICNRAFVPRFRRLSMLGNGCERLMLPNVDLRAVKALTIDGATVAPSALSVQTFGEVRYINGGRFGWLRPTGRGLEVSYEYGLDSPPADLRRAALIRFASRLSLSKTGVPDRAEFQIVDGRAFTLTTPGVRGSHTGIREVDEVYDAYAYNPMVEAATIR
jgi:hypothetical protein